MTRYLISYSISGQVLVDAPTEDAAKAAVHTAFDDPTFTFDHTYLSVTDLDEIRTIPTQTGP